MFGGKKSENNMSSGTTSSNPNASNIVTIGTKIEGTVSSESDIRIDGTLVGDLDCKGKVILGPKGKVEGNINCQNAVIEGSFTGTLKCADLLNVRESAVIQGDIQTEKLVVQSGAVYNVTCKMGTGGIKSIADSKANAS